MGIDPKYLTFDELLQKRLFEIPDYQRAYSWITKQRKDMFNDIEKLYNSGDYNKGTRNHFMATVVCCSKNKIEEFETSIYNILDIVDGQQRITTLIILLKAIRMKLDEQQNPKYRKTIFNLDELLVKDEDNRLILIQTNHSSSLILREYLISGKHPSPNTITTHAAANLVKAFEECKDFVEEWSNKYSVLELLTLLKNRINFILHILDDEGSVYTVFEVLNSRGLEVDWLDKCKSMLMGIAFEKLKPKSEIMFSEHLSWLHKYWSNIYECIGIHNIKGADIVRFAATLYHPQKQSRVFRAEEAIEFFRTICSTEPERVLAVSKWMLDVTQEVQSLYSNSKLSAVTDIIHARLVAVSINLSEHFSDEERKILLKQWENVTFRIFGLFQKDSRNKGGEYTKLAHFIMGTLDKKVYIDKSGRAKEVIKQLKAIGEDFQVKTNLKKLGEQNFYNSWEEELKYFFFRYEEFLAKENGYEFPDKVWETIWVSSSGDTIEHIYPQTESAAWEGKVTKRKEYHANRLGNLLILPGRLNSKIRNFGFEHKKNTYQTCQMLSTKVLLNYNDWNIHTIEERTQKLLEWAIEEWSDILI